MIHTFGATKVTTLLRSAALSFVLGLLSVCLSSDVHGGLLKGDVIKLDRSSGTFGGSSGGGEFAIHKFIGLDANNLEIWEQLSVPVFCLERNENIALGEKLIVGAVSDRAVGGGVAGQQNGLGDPLDDRTRFLYANYANNTLPASLNFDTNSHSWANAMQSVVWYLENEVSSIGSSSQAQALLTYANSYSAASYVGPPLSRVLALNLFSINAPTSAIDAFDPLDSSTWAALNSYKRQDQLYYQPPGGSNLRAVPEPGSGMVWLSLVGLAAVRRRRGRDS